VDTLTRVTPILTSRKDITISYLTTELLYSTPVSLPTTEPTTSQISYIVTELRLPIINIKPYKVVYVAFIFAGGKYAATSGYIYWRMLKNGASVSTGYYIIDANYYWTVQAQFYDVKVGDVLELRLWSQQSGSNLDYEAFHSQLTRLIPMRKPRILYPCNIASIATQPKLTQGNPGVYTYSSLTIKHLDRTLETIASASLYECLYPKDTYGIFQVYQGDVANANSALVTESLSYRPYYRQNVVPTRIILYGLKTEGQP
jgi:hypothetical protein